MPSSQPTQNMVTKVEETNGHNPVVKGIRTVLLAAAGTITLGKEEAEAIVNRLVEKGEIAEKDGRELIRDLFERRQKEATEVETKTSAAAESRFATLLARMNVPTRNDVEALTEKVTELSARVDTLSKKLS